MSKSPEEWNKEYRRQMTKAILWGIAALGFGVSLIAQVGYYVQQLR